MANLSLTGFRPWMNVGGVATQAIRRRVASNNGTAIFLGDCVKQSGAGVWGLATAGAGVGGVSQGASFFDATINGRRENTHLPASTTYSATVFDDYGNTDMSFIYVTADAVGDRFIAQYSASTVALADITKNANLLASAGSTVTGLSGHVIDQTSLNTTAALDFHLVDVWHNVLNDPAAASADVVVQINVAKLPPFGDTGTTAV